MYVNLACCDLCRESAYDNEAHSRLTMRDPNIASVEAIS